MEGAAIGHVCYVNHVPCAILRAISDGGDEAAATDYPTFLRAAAATASAVLLQFVERW
jgi:adenosylhomocysteine nucleosidase